MDKKVKLVYLLFQVSSHPFIQVIILVDDDDDDDDDAQLIVAGLVDFNTATRTINAIYTRVVKDTKKESIGLFMVPLLAFGKGVASEVRADG